MAKSYEVKRQRKHTDLPQTGVNWGQLFEDYCTQERIKDKKRTAVIKEYCNYLAPWIISYYNLKTPEEMAGFALRACDRI